jgi:DNA topoisomerase VI subunit B
MTTQTLTTTLTPAAKTSGPETFTTSRLLDFCSEKELTTQIGHVRAEWPLVILKELVDNGLDACEDASIAPIISVKVDASGIEVTDNGPGIPAATVLGACDFSSRTSSRAAYVGLARGAQGNAMQTILAMPYVASGDAGRGRVIIEACGQRHTIDITIDRVQGRPIITALPTPAVRNGTFVRLEMPLSASSEAAAADRSVSHARDPWIFGRPSVQPVRRRGRACDGPRCFFPSIGPSRSVWS